MVDTPGPSKNARQADSQPQRWGWRAVAVIKMWVPQAVVQRRALGMEGLGRSGVGLGGGWVRGESEGSRD